MSGFCTFCQLWHSASCCHPGQGQIALVEFENTKLRAEVEKLKQRLKDEYEETSKFGRSQAAEVEGLREALEETRTKLCGSDLSDYRIAAALSVVAKALKGGK